MTPTLGPDATGVGWAFMYSINSKERDLAELRSMQDWYLRYQLASVEGVSEVASVGGFVRQYQVTVDPTKLRAYNLSISEVAMAVRRANGEVGGRSIELAEKEFHPPRARLSPDARRPAQGNRGRGRPGRPDPAGAGRGCPVRPGYAPRDRGAERPGGKPWAAWSWCDTGPMPAK